MFFSSKLCFLEAQAVFFHVGFHYKIKGFCAQAVFFKFKAVLFWPKLYFLGAQAVIFKNQAVILAHKLYFKQTLSPKP